MSTQLVAILLVLAMALLLLFLWVWSVCAVSGREEDEQQRWLEIMAALAPIASPPALNEHSEKGTDDASND
jgi:hypothetical protein